MNRNLKTVAITGIGGALSLLLFGAGAYGVRVAKNAPPFVSETTFTAAIETLTKRVEQNDRNADVRQQDANVNAAWHWCLNAVEAGQSKQVIDQLSGQLASAKIRYQELTGNSYPLDCPPR